MSEQERQSISELMQFVVFNVRGQEFGVDIGSVKEITRTRNILLMPNTSRLIHGVMNLRGQIVPVIDPAGRLGLEPQKELSETARIMVAEAGDQVAGLLIDEVPKAMKIPLSDIEPTPELMHIEGNSDYIRGVAKLKNRLIIILDMEQFLTPYESDEAGHVSAAGAAVEQRSIS